VSADRAAECMESEKVAKALAQHLIVLVHCSQLVPEHVHILGERELNVLYYCLMNFTVNVFILVSVNPHSLISFHFISFSLFI